MRIKNNTSTLSSSRSHGIVQEQLGKSLEKLSFGYRINRTGGDAAGLAISEEVRHQINGLDQTMGNVNNGIGMTRADEGALAEVHPMLHHMKTLAIQAANGAYSSAARASIEEERLQLLDEIDRTNANTDFNQIPLFDIEVPVESFEPPKKKDDVTLQIRHTQKEEVPVACYHINSRTLKLDRTDFKGIDKTSASVEYIDKAIWAVTTVRSSFDAAGGHLGYMHNSLGVTKEGVTAYESGIRDMNTASRIAKLTSLNVVGQAAQSIQAHSSSLPEMILRLLQA